MKRKQYFKILLISILALFLLTSCKKDYTTKNPTTGIESLIIPSSFNWETSQYTTF